MWHVRPDAYDPSEPVAYGGRLHAALRFMRSLEVDVVVTTQQLHSEVVAPSARAARSNAGSVLRRLRASARGCAGRSRHEAAPLHTL